jgi:hypothetical protein
MTTQQLTVTQQPNTLDPVTQAAWDAWADERIISHLDSYTEVIAEEVGTTTGQHAKKILELLEIMQVLATDNAFLCGRIDQITREFKHQNGIEHKQVSRTEQTIATTHEERTSTRVQQVVRTIDEILSN